MDPVVAAAAEAREKHRATVFANAVKMGLEPISLIHVDGEALGVVVRDPKTGRTSDRTLGGIPGNREHVGTGPLGVAEYAASHVLYKRVPFPDTYEGITIPTDDELRAKGLLQ